MVFPDGSELGLFSFSGIYFFVYFFMVIMCFSLLFNFSLLLNPTYLVDVLIGDRLEKSVLSLMGLMRTDPPFLRRKIRGLKKKQSEKKREKIVILSIKRVRESKKNYWIMITVSDNFFMCFWFLSFFFCLGETGVAVLGRDENGSGLVQKT
jgi:hypothetical protein